MANFRFDGGDFSIELRDDDEFVVTDTDTQVATEGRTTSDTESQVARRIFVSILDGDILAAVSVSRDKSNVIYKLELVYDFDPFSIAISVSLVAV